MILTRVKPGSLVKQKFHDHRLSSVVQSVVKTTTQKRPSILVFTPRIPERNQEIEEKSEFFLSFARFLAPFSTGTLDKSIPYRFAQRVLHTNLRPLAERHFSLASQWTLNDRWQLRKKNLVFVVLFSRRHHLRWGETCANEVL